MSAQTVMRQIMKQLFLILTLSLIGVKVSFCQGIFQSQVNYGYSLRGLAIIQTKDNGYAVCGEHNPGPSLVISSHIHAYLAKFDGNGTLQWSRIIGDSNNFTFYGLAEASNGDIYCVGSTTRYDSVGQADADICIAKFTSTGTLEWSYSYGGTKVEYGQAITHTSDGNFVVAGQTNSFLDKGFGYGAYILKIDTAGQILWSRIMCGGSKTDNALAFGVTEQTDGTIAVTGRDYDNRGEVSTLFLTTLTADGKIRWNRKIKFKQEMIGSSVIPFNDHGYIVAANVGSTTNTEGYIARFDANGNLLWGQAIGLFGNCGFTSLAQLPAGDILAGGGVSPTTSFTTETDSTALVRIHPDGSLSDVYISTLPVNSYITSMCLTREGMIAYTGNTFTKFGSTPPTDFSLILGTFNSSMDGCNIRASLGTVDRGGTIIDTTFRVDSGGTRNRSNFLADLGSGGVQSDLCSISSVSSHIVNTKITIFPNPITHHSEINLQLTNEIAPGEYQMTLHDLLGKEVYSKQIFISGSEQVLSLELPYLASGTYIVELQNRASNDATLRTKVVVR
jgi:hypothetical protein